MNEFEMNEKCLLLLRLQGIAVVGGWDGESDICAWLESTLEELNDADKRRDEILAEQNHE